MLRGPINAIIEGSLRNFYETCGYEEDFRDVISELTEKSLDEHIDAIVADAMAQDTSGNESITPDQFKAWSKKNRHVGQWVDNLSRFVISGIGGEVTISDFHDGDFDVIPLTLQSAPNPVDGLSSLPLG